MVTHLLIRESHAKPGSFLFPNSRFSSVLHFQSAFADIFSHVDVTPAELPVYQPVSVFFPALFLFLTAALGEIHEFLLTLVEPMFRLYL